MLSKSKHADENAGNDSTVHLPLFTGRSKREADVLGFCADLRKAGAISPKNSACKCPVAGLQNGHRVLLYFSLHWKIVGFSNFRQSSLSFDYLVTRYSGRHWGRLGLCLINFSFKMFSSDVEFWHFFLPLWIPFGHPTSGRRHRQGCAMNKTTNTVRLPMLFFFFYYCCC